MCGPALPRSGLPLKTVFLASTAPPFPPAFTDNFALPSSQPAPVFTAFRSSEVTCVVTGEPQNPFNLPGFTSPIEQHTLTYDSFDESLEAFYFWLLDELTADGWTISKLADTFTATPASGLFSDLTRRESQAQREVMKMLKEAHALVRDILRTTTFLKEEAKFSDQRSNESGPDYQLERSLLKSKLETLKLYARWLGPYLRQARQTKQSDGGGAAVVNLFNTATAEVTLLAQSEYPVAEDVDRGELPKMFLNAKRRPFYSVLIIEWKIRAAPERNSSGGYGYRGRFDLTLTSYALNADELAVLHQELNREDLDELIHSVGDDSARTLQDLVKEIDSLINEPSKYPRPKGGDLGMGLCKRPRPGPQRGLGQIALSPVAHLFAKAQLFLSLFLFFLPLDILPYPLAVQAHRANTVALGPKMIPPVASLSQISKGAEHANRALALQPPHGIRDRQLRRYLHDCQRAVKTGQSRAVVSN
jgi:hypothetical protein